MKTYEQAATKLANGGWKQFLYEKQVRDSRTSNPPVPSGMINHL